MNQKTSFRKLDWDRVLLKTSDYSVSKEDFELYKHCKYEILCTDPIPSNLGAYYESEDYISHTDSRNSLKDSLYQMVKRRQTNQKLKWLKNHHPNKGNLLDFGAGTGDFVFAAEKHGWHVSGVEPSSKARKKASEKYIELYKDLESVQTAKFEVITLWHVLEHIVDLDKVVTKLKSLLTDDGVLVIAVPNYKSWDSKFYKEYWAALDVPRHVWHFSRSGIENMMHDFGFQLVNSKIMWYDSFYVSLLSEQYKNGGVNWFSAFLVGFISNLRALFTKESSSVVYFFKQTGNKPV